MSFNGSYYGNFQQTSVESKIDLMVEEIDLIGFTILENVLNLDECKYAISRLEELNKHQQLKFGNEVLSKVGENNQIRLPLQYDEIFMKMASHEKIHTVIDRVIGGEKGGYYQLQQQNGVINKPDSVHHQSFWHRDFPYLNYEISRPLAVNAYYCLTDFFLENGSTIVLPYSHNKEIIPSNKYIDKYQISTELKAGSVILFNSQLFHKAGFNNTNENRVGVNNVFTTPMFKQQVDIPFSLNGKYKENEFLNRLFGYNNQVPNSSDEIIKKYIKQRI